MSKRHRGKKIPFLQSLQRSINVVRAEVAAFEREHSGQQKHPRRKNRRRRNLSADALEKLRPEVMIESR